VHVHTTLTYIQAAYLHCMHLHLQTLFQNQSISVYVILLKKQQLIYKCYRF